MSPFKCSLGMLVKQVMLTHKQGGGRKVVVVASDRELRGPALTTSAAFTDEAERALFCLNCPPVMRAIHGS